MPVGFREYNYSSYYAELAPNERYKKHKPKPQSKVPGHMRKRRPFVRDEDFGYSKPCLGYVDPDSPEAKERFFGGGGAMGASEAGKEGSEGVSLKAEGEVKKTEKATAEGGDKKCGCC